MSTAIALNHMFQRVLQIALISMLALTLAACGFGGAPSGPPDAPISAPQNEQDADEQDDEQTDEQAEEQDEDE